MKCDDIIEKLEEYYLDTLKPIEKSAIESHLRECKKCQSEFAQVEKLIWYLDKFKEDVIIDGKETKVRKFIPNVKWLSLATAASILLSILVYLLLIKGEDFVMNGNATIQRGQSKFSIAQVNNLKVGDHIFAESDSLLLVNGCHKISIEKGTVLQILGEKSIALNSGKILCEIQKGGEGFPIKTPLGIVEVIGTKFIVEVFRKEEDMNKLTSFGIGTLVGVTVVSGYVYFTKDDTKITLKPGESIIAEKDKELLRTSTEKLKRLAESENKLSESERENSDLKAKIYELESKNTDLMAKVKSLEQLIKPPTDTTHKEESKEAKIERLLKNVDWGKIGKALYDAKGKITPELVKEFLPHLSTMAELQKLLGIPNMYAILNHEQTLKYVIPNYLKSTGKELTDEQKTKFNELLDSLWKEHQKVIQESDISYEIYKKWSEANEQLDTKTKEILGDKSYEMIKDSYLLHISYSTYPTLDTTHNYVGISDVSEIVNKWIKAYGLDDGFKSLLEPIASDLVKEDGIKGCGNVEPYIKATKKILQTINLNEEQTKKVKQSLIFFFYGTIKKSE